MYIVKKIRGDTAVLVSENGEATMIIRKGELMPAGFELVYD